MKTKKIVFVIVEGPSDETALGLLLTRIYDKNIVYVAITHGDITSDYRVNPSNIVNKITEYLQNYAKSNHYKKSDFLEVIHIVDMDGAYIDENCILYEETAKKPRYEENGIYTSHVERIKERNIRKKMNLNRICSLEKVWKTIPYKCYYMSCNLDHVLYNVNNISDDEKEIRAHQFVKMYKDHISDFLDFIINSSFSVIEDYRKSWDYIKLDNHSLNRYSNLGIAFKEEMNKNNKE